MKVAALDLGTNTFICLLAEGHGRHISIVHGDRVEVVRLGQELHKNGFFHPEALARAQTCLQSFKKDIDSFKPDRILAVATSAARDAQNGEKLFEMGRHFGIPIEIIEGEREAQVSFRGALVGFPVEREKVAVIDIGGGSTEVTCGQGMNLELAKSINIGGVRLTERFIKSQPVPLVEQEQLQQFLRQEWQQFKASNTWNGSKKLFAVAGTPTSLAVLELGGFVAAKVDGYVLGLAGLKKWLKTFADTSVEQKKQKYQLGGRADIIYVGTSILVEFMQMFDFSEVVVSTKGVRYGVALELLQA